MPTGRNRQCSFVHCVLVRAVIVHIRQVVAVVMLALGAFLYSCWLGNFVVDAGERWSLYASGR